MRSARRPIALLGLLVFMLILALLPGGSATATPSPEDAERQLQALGVQLDHINEQANSVRVQLKRARAQKAGLERQLTGAQDSLDVARDQVGQIAQSAYRDGGLRLSSSLLEGSPGDFFERMGTLTWLSDQQRATLATAKVRQGQYDVAKQRVDLQIRNTVRLQKQLDGRKAELNKQLAKWERIKRSVASSAPRPSSSGSSSSGSEAPRAPQTPRAPRATYDGPATGSGARAARFALAQLGEPYVFGAAGPGAWDCSGLTQVAWAQAGVSLPHSAHLQYYQIRHVSRANLQVGDLVFFYSLEHVGVYIGNNRVVHAPTPGEPVKITNINYMPYAGAGRP